MVPAINGREHRQSTSTLGKKAAIGILPTTAIGSTDLHSMVQFYLAGPSSTYTTFLSVETNKSDLVVPQQNAFEKLVPNIQDKQLASIMSAILQGVFHAYEEKQRPFLRHCHTRKFCTLHWSIAPI